MDFLFQSVNMRTLTAAGFKSVARLLLLSAFLAVALAFAGTQSAHAAGVVGDGTPGSCNDANYAAAMTGGGTVTFNCGPDPVTIKVTTKVILAGETTVIDGNNKVTLDGDKLVQLFIVVNGGELTLRNITLTGGANFNGSAIYNSTNGVVFVYRSRITENGADPGGVAVTDGGAIYNLGLMDIEQSVVSYNKAAHFGGGIFNEGTLTIRKSFMHNNTAIAPIANAADGGAIYNDGELHIEESHLGWNRAERYGGGLRSVGGDVEITNSTIRENYADQGGGIFAGNLTTIEIVNATIERNNADTAANIWNGGAMGTISIHNTIIAKGSTEADDGTPSLDCDGPGVTSLGYNIIGDGTCVNPGLPSDQRNTDPMLHSINDDPVPAAVPMVGSPAIDMGDPASCPARDQRGVTRPQGARCDVGAVEIAVIEGGPSGIAVLLPIVTK